MQAEVIQGCEAVENGETSTEMVWKDVILLWTQEPWLGSKLGK